MLAVLKIAVVAALAAAVGLPATASATNCTKRTTGTCTDAGTGQRVKIANRAQTLRLKSIAVKIVGQHVVVPTLGPFDDFSDTATAKGRFVVFVVKVTNRGANPVDTIMGLDWGLKVGRATYDNAFDAENLIGSPALINAHENNTIQPGLSGTGYIAFDVARTRTALVRTNGNLMVDDKTDRRWGLIRTYR